MKRKHFISAIVIASLLSPLSWAYTGGTGEPNDPYRLSAVADWQQLMATSNDWDKHFILTADLDLQGVTLNPVGSDFDSPFAGVFDGNGHIIRNAAISLPNKDHVGLFGYLGAGGELRDLGVEDVNITGDDYVGGLVGYNDYGTLTTCYATGQVTGTGNWCVGGLVGISSGTLTSCYATGQVTGDWEVGGLVGWNSGTLNSCYATGQVTGGWYVGGLVGISSGTLTSCYATGQVTGYNLVGGLVGDNWDGTLTSCYATGYVAGDEDVGGLVGYNDYGTLTSCYAAGQVTGVWCVGGLVGENYHGTLTSCYATGQVTGDRWVVGGLVGYNDVGALIACYATGQVTGDEAVGGLVEGKWGGTVSACFWDIETSGQFTSDGGQGKTTAQMKDINTFLDAGWDFVEIWDIGENQTYPFLRTHPAGDINHDDKVNFLDLAILAENWLAGR